MLGFNGTGGGIGRGVFRVVYGPSLELGLACSPPISTVTDSPRRHSQ